MYNLCTICTHAVLQYVNGEVQAWEVKRCTMVVHGAGMQVV